MKSIFFYFALILTVGISSFASNSVDVGDDFYVQMSQTVVTDRSYQLSSNVHALLDMGSGDASYETLTFLKFDPNSIPDAPVTRAWLRMESGPSGTMGDATRSVKMSVHPVDLDVMGMVDGTIDPRDFYVNENHILDSVDSLWVFGYGICYWDVTEAVNQWIAFAHSSGQEGYENLGLAVTGRDDTGADDPEDNEHVGFYASEAVSSSAYSHRAMPVLIFTTEDSGFGDPWIPDWQSSLSWTHQQWLFSAANGRCEQPLAPDGYCLNAFGDPNVVWEEETQIGDITYINPYLTWHPFVEQVVSGSHPDWVDGVYGALYYEDPSDSANIPYDAYTLTAHVPTGSQAGTLKVFVQYDWYEGGTVEVQVPDGVDVTPTNYADYELGLGENDDAWLRSTKVFELSDNPGQISVEVTISGDEPYVDALSVTTAVDVSLPDDTLRNAQDVNLDGYVNLGDFGVLSEQWQPETVGLDELLALVEQWLDVSCYAFSF